MGLANVVHMCSHLQNASRARLGLTSVPFTKYNLSVALAMHRAGYISFVTRGGAHPPDPATITTYEPAPLTTANVAKQRLWLGLKYNISGGGTPVLGTMVAITTPKRPHTAKLNVLERLARGFDSGSYRGLNIGESLFMHTSLGTLEVREAIEKKVGGLLLCRVGPPMK
ncbi:ribosomal protein S8 [Annulohypoxylon maeteangense]|uniref:ribosomal protein S8 n=1 Tax=Annulohypoxylon maeteangense TaxID=1927788 RepID=UPI0020078C48|nr:ribosomal protein S8 [Annulohypoxylon maeteangense]KAI0881351.1 ribosomal protein S8 [Annulohypoxylon maeteangense]